MKALIHDAVRTTRGKAKPEGGLASETPQSLIVRLVDAMAERGHEPRDGPDLLSLGCVGQTGAQGGHIALVAKLAAGLPEATAAHSLNNFCAAGLSAIGQAAALIEAGVIGKALAGGVEMMSRVPFMADRADYYTATEMPPRQRYIPVALAADLLAVTEGITRAELDAVALTSQTRAVAAETDPALVASRIATGRLNRDETPRATDAAKLSALPPAFAALGETYRDALDDARHDPLHTLAHAPPMADGAGLALLAAPGAAPRGRARARILGFAEAGGDPRASLLAGFTAMDRALEKAGLPLDAMDRIEFMEAFAVVIAKFLRDRPADPARLNVSGGHLAKGHPMGATGAILLSTLLDTLDAADGRYGLVVATGAQGVGAAMVVERLQTV